MTEPPPERPLPLRVVPDVPPPSVQPPTPAVERRRAWRREEDRIAYEEARFLARALDLLTVDAPAEVRLAALLAEAGRIAGARRTALLSEDPERRVAVVVAPGEPPGAGEALATWLDVQAPRSRAERAASGRARVATVVDPALAPRRPPGPDVDRACLPVESAGSLVLGFEFETPAEAKGLPARLPDSLARHLAAALALATEQLERERELAALRARDDERTRFVSTVAHELRTPLTGLAGYLDLILGGRVAEPEVQQDFLERGRQSVASMSELVGDLLELSRLDSGSLQLELGPFSLAEAGQRTADRLLPIAIDRGIGLRTALPPRIRAATGDRRRVEQILTNLLGNALKFTAVGGTVELEGWTSGSVAFYAVRDDGEGIAPDVRARIFERFYRQAGHQRITGTGLGLPIARDLARAMGGDLDVASVPGTGSSFLLALPGPAPVEPEAIATALKTAVVSQELALEERSVRRALAAAGRSAPPQPAGSGLAGRAR